VIVDSVPLHPKKEEKQSLNPDSKFGKAGLGFALFVPAKDIAPVYYMSI
jgi:hypothetical protein